MSFHDDFVLQLRADLAQALGLPGEAIYVGRAPQKVTRQGLEVWIRPGDCESVVSLQIRRYDLHVRHKARREGALTGELQLGPVVRALGVIGERYDGQRPFARALPALLAVEVDGDMRIDDDEEDQDVLDGRLTLRVGVRL